MFIFEGARPEKGIKIRLKKEKSPFIDIFQKFLQK